jgi:prepilin signal peptidase PulO-like enzyme (type II secretory pathway)
MITLILAVILGWIGSLIVNYLSDVLPITRNLSRPDCIDCQVDLELKFYLLNQPCENCGNKPSVRHWIVFVLGPILAGLIYFIPPPNLGLWGGILWLILFGLIVVIDLEHRLILHPVSLTGAALGIIFGSINHGFLNTIVGGAAGFGIMLVFYMLGNVFIKFLSHKRGEYIDEVALGFGDVNLAGVIGLLLGWPGVIAGVFLAIIIGGVISGIFLLLQIFRKRYEAFQALPYGPFLVISVVLLLYYSQFVK